MSDQLINKRYGESNHEQNQHLIRDAVVRARVSSDLKHDVEGVLHRLGITMSEAICLYLSQIKLNNGIPFNIKIPNEDTMKVFAETDSGKNVIKVKNIREIFDKAGF